MISVIIPYKNAARYIPRCAQSLLQQDGDFEFIFVNDSSEDDGPEILKEYADDRFVMIYNSCCSGVSGARNAGLENAEGDWITFLDVDDVMLPNDGELYGCILGEVDADIYQFNHYRYYVEINKRALKFTNPAGYYGLDHLPRQWCMIWNKIFRRDLLDGIWFKEGTQYGEDELFVLECLVKARQIYCSAEVGIQRYFDNKQSLSRVKTPDDLLQQMANLTNFFIEHDDPEVRRAMLGIISEHWSSKTFERAFCE